MRLVRNIYDNLEEYACAGLVAVMIMCLILQVFMRFLFGSALAWSEELSRYAFLWSVYVGAALAVKRDAHVRITAQFMKMGTQKRLFFRMVCDAVWLGFNIFLVMQSIEVIRDGLEFPEMSPTLGVTKAYVEMIIPFGFALMSWRIIERYYADWKGKTLSSLVNYEEQA